MSARQKDKIIIEMAPGCEHLRELAESIACGGVPADARVVYRGRNLVAAISDVTDPAAEINVKAFHKPRFVNSLVYTTLRHGKAERSFRYGCRLAELGFLTPEPIGYIEVRRGSRLLESYYLSRQVEATEMRHTYRLDFEETLLQALGREMARLHKSGVLMLDFSPGNVLFVPDETNPADFKFYYVDLNRTRFGISDHAKLMAMFKAIMENDRQVEVIARAYAREMGLDEAATVETALSHHRRFRRRWERKKKIKSLLRRL